MSAADTHAEPDAPPPASPEHDTPAPEGGARVDERLKAEERRRDAYRI
jgi:hypothetical protein